MRMGLSNCSRSLALNLLDQYDNHLSTELLRVPVDEGWFAPGMRSNEPFSALHCISYFGIAEVAIDLIRMNRWDVNQIGGRGLTPLMRATRHGCKVVQLLLQKKHTQPNMPDTGYDRTALSWAAESGHEGVVKLFLGSIFCQSWAQRP